MSRRWSPGGARRPGRDDGRLQGVLGALGAAGNPFLTAGEHTLRPERTAAVPHIAALALRRDPRQIAGATLEALPPEAHIRDDFLVQEWMIWSIPGIQSYTVRDGAYVIQNGRHSFNRPLFGPPGPSFPL